MSLNAPDQILVPFADGGVRTTPIPPSSDNTTGRAGYDEGFPPVTMILKAAGGIPPWGPDFNGLFYSVTLAIQYLEAGGSFVYDNAFATAIGGYNEGAVVLRTDGLGFWLNTIDGNVTDPEGGGGAAAGWVPHATNGVSAITMTNANVTLTELQYGKPIIVITGLLTGNLNLIFPNVAGQWVILNNTTGDFSITAKTASGTGVVVKKSLAIFGDGTNIYPEASAIGVMSQNSAAAGGTADALTAVLSPAPASLASIAGVPFWVRAASANATTTPTFAPNGLTAKTYVKGSNLALAAGDIPGAGAWLLQIYDLTLDKWVLLNPATGVTAPNGINLISTQNASGASVSFAIPSTARRVVCNLLNVSSSGVNGLITRLNSETTTYGGSIARIANGVSPVADPNGGTTGFLFATGVAATDLYSGRIIFERADLTTNAWICTVEIERTDGLNSFVFRGGGHKVPAAPLSTISFHATGADTYDGGTISAWYQT